MHWSRLACLSRRFCSVQFLGVSLFPRCFTHRYSRAWQRQHWHHERHAHDGHGRRRGIPARFRQGHRVGLHWHGCDVVFDGQLRELWNSAWHSDDGLQLWPYFQPVAGLSRRQGHRCGHWRIVRVLGPAAACIELFGIFAVLVALTRYVSVGSIASAALCPVIACFLFWGDGGAIALFFVTGMTVVGPSCSNIERLRAGNEASRGFEKIMVRRSNERRISPTLQAGDALHFGLRSSSCVALLCGFSISGHSAAARSLSLTFGRPCSFLLLGSRYEGFSCRRWFVGHGACACSGAWWQRCDAVGAQTGSV